MPVFWGRLDMMIMRIWTGKKPSDEDARKLAASVEGDD